MKIQVNSEDCLYIELNGWTYYIDDSTNEQIINVWKSADNEYGKRSLKTTEINSLYTYKRQDNIIGNVFYSHGMLVFTDTSGSYKGSSLFNDYSLQFKGSVDRTVHNYQCVVRDDEYNVTLNPTARVGYNINNPTLKPFTTSSDFNPYISSVGLYNAQNELLAVAKLSRPIKKPKEYDISFTIRFDN